jgi:dihydroorotase
MALYDLIIHSAQVMTPSGLASLDIGVANGRITALAPTLPRTQAAKTLDAKGLTVLPGIIDSQVHFREPGLEHKEDLSTGTAGAALGGVTTIFEMPNTKPFTITEATLADKLNRAKGRAWTNYAFFAGASPDNLDELAHLDTLPGCSGVKLFMGSSTGHLLVPDDEAIKRVMQAGKRRMSIHAEDEYRLAQRRHLVEVEGVTVHQHPVWRDEEVCLNATKRVVRLAREVGRRVHVLHISTRQEIEFLAQNKDIATVEVLPQHLTLIAPDCYDRLGTYAQMNPAIRGQEHYDGLWRGIEQGIVDVLGSDHAPHTHEEKARSYPASPSGMTSVQTMLPLMLNHVSQGRLTLERLVDLLAYGPQRVFGIVGKGRIAVGYDADLTLVDLAAKRTITHQWMASKVGWTPFDGMDVTGWPIHTVVGGHCTVQDETLIGAPMGQAVKFWETIQPEQ